MTRSWDDSGKKWRLCEKLTMPTKPVMPIDNILGLLGCPKLLQLSWRHERVPPPSRSCQSHRPTSRSFHPIRSRDSGARHTGFDIMRLDPERWRWLGIVRPILINRSRPQNGALWTNEESRKLASACHQWQLDYVYGINTSLAPRFKGYSSDRNRLSDIKGWIR